MFGHKSPPLEWLVSTMRSGSAKNALSSFAVFAAVLIFLLSSGRERGGFRIDEAHKVADTYFFHLLQTGDFANPDWFRHIADRTNPPVGKFLFGLSAWLHGATLPTDLSRRIEEPDGSLGQRLRGDEREIIPVLVAARRVSIIATALTAAVVFSAAAFVAGPAAGVAAVILFVAHYLTLTYSATAIYDPLLTLFVALSMLPLLHLSRESSKRRLLVSSIVAGLVAAAAFQTRLSGLIGLAALTSVFIARWLITKRKELLQFVLVAIPVFVVVAAAVNPFYWSNPRAPGLQSNAVLPLRIVERFSLQVAELSELLSRQVGDQEMLDAPGDKLRYAAEILLGDLTGMLTLLGWGIAAFFLVTGSSRQRVRAIALLSWCILIIGLLTFWIPLAWPRYMLVAIPPFALGGAVGWGELIRAGAGVGRGRPRSGRGDRNLE